MTEDLHVQYKKMMPERSCVQLDSGKVACGTYLGPQVESGKADIGKPILPDIIWK